MHGLCSCAQGQGKRRRDAGGCGHSAAGGAAHLDALTVQQAALAGLGLAACPSHCHEGGPLSICLFRVKFRVADCGGAGGEGRQGDPSPLGNAVLIWIVFGTKWAWLEQTGLTGAWKTGSSCETCRHPRFLGMPHFQGIAINPWKPQYVLPIATRHASLEGRRSNLKCTRTSALPEKTSAGCTGCCIGSDCWLEPGRIIMNNICGRDFIDMVPKHPFTPPPPPPPRCPDTTPFALLCWLKPKLPFGLGLALAMSFSHIKNHGHSPDPCLGLEGFCCFRTGARGCFWLWSLL